MNTELPENKMRRLAIFLYYFRTAAVFLFLVYFKLLHTESSFPLTSGRETSALGSKLFKREHLQPCRHRKQASAASAKMMHQSE